MNSVLAILQARMSSTRLPGKVMRHILGRPMLALQIERLRRSAALDQIVIATSDCQDDDPIVELCASEHVECYRGALDDVLDRFYRTALYKQPHTIIRITGDCPLADPALIDRMMNAYRSEECDYLTNAIQPSFPDGLDIEIFRFACLEVAWREALLPSEREHVTPYIHRRPERFKIVHYQEHPDTSGLRWTVDNLDDFELITAIYEALYPANPAFTSYDVLTWLDVHPQWKTYNITHMRNEGAKKSEAEDACMLLALQQRNIALSGRYRISEELLDRAERTIPLGTQTFSKSRTQYPFGVSPYFIDRAQGSHVWDVDGNEYVDFVMSLAAITLGYQDPDVTDAVRHQLDNGVIFTLPHRLEMEVAERLVELVPCAELVRFGKNGSDATSGAIRLARAYTGRDRVAVCGYHGWQDWYIGSTARNLGVPESVRKLTHSIPYNDLDALQVMLMAHEGEFAAVILEPMNVVFPAKGYLEGVRDITHRHGALLVFDETITGFRYELGGAQQRFGVMPDLAAFGKGMANGYPLSAVCGRADVMKLMEEIFFSFTFGGELLSLAAAKATLDKMQREPVIAHLKRMGGLIQQGIAERIERHGLADVLSVAGDSTWSFLVIRDHSTATSWEIKTLFLQEMFACGVLTLGTFNVSYAHSEADVTKLLDSCEMTFRKISLALSRGDVRGVLRCTPLEPLFKVR